MHFVFSILGISIDITALCSLLLSVECGTNCTYSAENTARCGVLSNEKRYLCTFEEQTMTHPCKLQLEA